MQTTLRPTTPASADPVDLLVATHGDTDHPTLRTPDSVRAYLLALTGGGWRAPRAPAFTADELTLSEP